MCGIAGSINADFSNESVLQAMRHRGPDEQAEYRNGNVHFYHLRLSILDIACGKQPMHLDDRYTIIFNGEIYNHREVREKFGLTGKTSSDTETLLLLYEKLGIKFLDHLDGMFVFVIHDKMKNSLFIARDRAGKKPFYYFYDHKKIVFASELNGLKAMIPLQPEPGHFYQYLRLGTFYRENTPYKDVRELRGGYYMTVDCNTLATEEFKWWNIHEFYQISSPDSFEESLAKTDQILHTAIRRRLETSDLEVGCFLSGGIDSGLVSSIASQYNSGLKTFTVSFPGAYNEAPLAKLVAQKYNTHHQEISISFDQLEDDVEKILTNYGEPFFDSSAIPSYYVSKAAKEYVTVILNGDGADELFGGYRRYVPFAKYDFFQSNAAVRRIASLLTKLLPAGNRKKSMYNYLYRLASLASHSGVETYLSAGVDIFEGFTQYLLAPDDQYLDPLKRDFQSITGSNLSGLEKLMNLDFDIMLLDDLLVKMDIATMANSQEGRSPFMCKEFLEYVPTLPDSFKIKGKTTKVLLRKLAESYLPSELINQPKRGFEIPLKNWVNHQLKNVIHSYIDVADPYVGNFVQKQFIRRLLNKQISISEEKRAKMIWTLFSMEVWAQKIKII